MSEISVSPEAQRLCLTWKQVLTLPLALVWSTEIPVFPYLKLAGIIDPLHREEQLHS